MTQFIDYDKAAAFASDVRAYAAEHPVFCSDRLAAWVAAKGYAAYLSEGRFAAWLAWHGWPGPRTGRVTFLMCEGGLMYRMNVDVRFVRQHGALEWRAKRGLRNIRRRCSLKVRSA